jgi:hypothetical protein
MLSNFLVKLIDKIEDFFSLLDKYADRWYYGLKTKLRKKKPYFSREKYIKDMMKTRMFSSRVLQEELNNPDAYFKVLDGRELIQESKTSFRPKTYKKSKYELINRVYIDWVVWK